METEALIGRKYMFATTLEQNSNLPPQFSELANKDHILYGETNDYPDYLIELFNRASTHNAIVKGKQRYILGNGFMPNAELPKSQFDRAMMFIESVNLLGESLYDVVSPAVLDWLIYGGFSLKAKAGILSKKPEQLYYRDFSMFRATKEQHKFYESEYWVFDARGTKRTIYVKPQDAIPINRFNYQKPSEGLIYYCDSRPQMKFYPLPEYIGAIQDIETEISIAEFHNNNVKSGFSAGYIIEFTNGVPELDEQERIIQDLKEKYAAARASGEMFVTFADQKDRGVNVIPIRPNDLDKQFEVLRKDVTQSIVTNHNITSPMLMAIKTEGQLGGNNEIQTAAEMFQNTYVANKQNALCRVINKWFKEKEGFDAGIFIEPLKPVRNNLPLASVMDVLTDDEKRELAGLPPMTKEQKVEVSQKKKEAQAQKFSDDGTEELLQALKDCAIDLDGEIVAQRPCMKDEDFSNESISLFERSFIQCSSVFDLPYYQSVVYQFLDKNKGKYTVAKIAKELSIAPAQVELALKQLQEQNYLNFKYLSDGTLSNFKINPVSDAALKEGVPAFQLVTRWQYSGPNDDRNRPFCHRMLNEEGLAGKLWKRQDIDRLSATEDRNVWLTRGGWYTLPNGNKRPSCRHFWSQVIVKINGNG